MTCTGGLSYEHKRKRKKGEKGKKGKREKKEVLATSGNFTWINTHSWPFN